VELVVERTYAAHPLRVWLDAPGADLLRMLAPGLPGDTAPRPFLLLRTRGGSVRWVSLLDPGPGGRRDAARGLGTAAGQVTVTLEGATVRYLFGPGSVSIEDDAGSRTLRGARPAPAEHRPLIEARDAPGPVATAARVAGPPALDGTLEGFEAATSLRLDEEQQYRRSETPYDPECFRAEGWIDWDPDGLYVAVSVTKPNVVVRDPSVAPLELDNEPDDIHADGIQLHFSVDDEAWGLAVALEPGGALGIRQLGPEEPAAAARGRWATTEEGYLLTLAVSHPRLPLFHGARTGFDLLVNEMQPGRLRRSGQLVWSGHGGWVYLRGDRHLPSEFGVLELL
jgi:hypothetical protein